MRVWIIKVFLGPVCAILALTCGSLTARAQLDLNLEQGTIIPEFPEAVAAFSDAADVWKQYITSPIRINIFVDYFPFPIGNENVIGATALGPINPNLDYTTVRNAMAARASKPGNEILQYLPTSAQISANVRSDLHSVFDKTTIGITSANQKALGLIPSSPDDNTLDGIIVFNSNFNFDFDPSDGVDSDKIDFRTAAVHEIGHLLGFLSDVDDFDRPARDENGNIVETVSNATTVDLFRFATDLMPTTPEEFTHFPREMRPDVEANFTDLVDAYRMSTGRNFGDGNQASHWKDNFIFNDRQIYFGELIGVMDPTLPFGETELISAADLRALELIGYDTVPEPSVMGLVVIAGALLRRRRNARLSPFFRAFNH